MVWYGMIWYGMVWYGMVWYGMELDVMVWYGMAYGMAPNTISLSGKVSQLHGLVFYQQTEGSYCRLCAQSRFPFCSGFPWFSCRSFFRRMFLNGQR